MKQLIAVVLSAALSTLLMACATSKPQLESSTSADTAKAPCAVASVNKLKKKLTALSPYEGHWRFQSWSGPVKFSLKESAGIHYVEWTGSDEKRTYPLTELMPEFPEKNKVRFGEKDHITVELQPDCSLGGSVKHGNGTSWLSLESDGNASESKNLVSEMFQSKEAFKQFLLEEGPFKGTWKWQEESAGTAFLFHEKDGSLSAVFTHEMDESEGGGKTDMSAVEVEILSPARVRLLLPGRFGLVHLEIKDKDTLEGVQVFDREYALPITVSSK